MVCRRYRPLRRGRPSYKVILITILAIFLSEIVRCLAYTIWPSCTLFAVRTTSNFKQASLIAIDSEESYNVSIRSAKEGLVASTLEKVITDRDLPKLCTASLPQNKGTNLRKFFAVVKIVPRQGSQELTILKRSRGIPIDYLFLL